MKKNYSEYFLLIGGLMFLSMLITSCKKDNSSKGSSGPKSLATLGLYELDSGIYKRIFIPITQIGTQTVSYYGVFDTGSSGMTIDANGIIPASMITSSGITVPGDSVVVNGITITSQQATMSYGNSTSETQEKGNLAYATVKIGTTSNNLITRRIPFFLYYKITNITTGKALPAHSNDVFGVGPGVSYANNHITSPLSYFTGANLTSGFKLSALPTASFSINGTYVDDLLSIGLVPNDLLASSGFIMHPLAYFSQGGYSPDIPATITYNGQTVSATVLFDTGTPAISIIENPAAGNNTTALPDGTSVTLVTTSGFSYKYTAGSSGNLTSIDKPSYTGDPRTIFSLDFFTQNEFLMDYADHKIGLKNN